MSTLMARWITIAWTLPLCPMRLYQSNSVQTGRIDTAGLCAVCVIPKPGGQTGAPPAEEDPEE